MGTLVEWVAFTSTKDSAGDYLDTVIIGGGNWHGACEYLREFVVGLATLDNDSVARLLLYRRVNKHEKQGPHPFAFEHNGYLMGVHRTAVDAENRVDQWRRSARGG